MCNHTSETIKICTPMPLDLSEEAYRIAVDENPNNLIPDFDPAMLSAKQDRKIRLALVSKKKWQPGRTLRIRFLDGDPVVQRKIVAYAQQWTEFANIKLDFGSDPNAEIRISFRDSGSWSALGIDALSERYKGGKATMNYGWLDRDSSEAEYSRVVLHEFGHALGCIHEHQHPEADIPWDREAVYRHYQRTQGWSRDDVDRNVLNKYDRDSTQFSRFDTTSIMIYAIPNSLTKGDYEVGWNRYLSETDKNFIRQAYPSTERLNGVYQIKSKYSGKCLDLNLAEGENTVNGTNVHQWDCHGSDNQKWLVTPLEDSSYKIQSKYSGKCLDLSLPGSPETVNGTNIHQWDCHDGDNQKWLVTLLDDGGYQIKSQHSRKCLDLNLANGENTANGTNIQQWDYHGGDNQRWILIPST